MHYLTENLRWRVCDVEQNELPFQHHQKSTLTQVLEQIPVDIASAKLDLIKFQEPVGLD